MPLVIKRFPATEEGMQQATALAQQIDGEVVADSQLQETGQQPQQQQAGQQRQTGPVLRKRQSNAPMVPNQPGTGMGR